MTRYTRIISSIFFLAVTVRLVCFVGLIGSDDLNYNRSAYTLVAGTAPPTYDHQGTRLGTFLPVALMFKLFGVKIIYDVHDLWLVVYDQDGLAHDTLNYNTKRRRPPQVGALEGVGICLGGR